MSNNYPTAYVDILLPKGKRALAPANPRKSLEIKGNLKLRAKINKVIDQKPGQTLVVKNMVNIVFVLPPNSELTWSSIELRQYDPWGGDDEGNRNMPIYLRKILDPVSLVVVNHYEDQDDEQSFVWKMRLWFRRNGMLVYIDPDIENQE